jgi:isoleucyl-tRNA synthetase
MNGEDFALADKDVGDVARKLSMIWNVYDFFTMYADVDGWEWNGQLEHTANDSQNILDTWIVSKLHKLITDVESSTLKYDLQSATRYILPFVDELSNWYVRRSRKRFWKSDDAEDKQNAYKTLHYVLVQLAHVLAPFTPFLAEELYRNLTGGESVHLNKWPEVGHVNEQVIREMDAVRSVVNEGLSQRVKAQLKVRQPLAKVSVTGGEDLGPREGVYIDVLREELNVKSVDWDQNGESGVELATELNDELRAEGYAREIVRFVQQARKKAELDVDDRISLALSTDNAGLAAAVEAHSSYITEETLADTLVQGDLQGGVYTSEHKINGSDLKLSLKKA